ncbi:MAG: helix-turn-helix transcriptional regulator [Lachnospiraceae bacterium]|nr:AraC family transcriptional regulator [uncultured Schaedlerella sp.]MCI8775687.1 helix-turn-helix transcriptional regulator [Lachnospiraceae bacterium]
MRGLMKKMELLLELPIFYTEDKEIIPKSFGTFPEESPFIHAPFLAKLLIERAERQILPVIYKDENELFFICVKGKKGFYLTGPACTNKMDFVRLHSFYKCYGITRKEEKYPLRTTLSRIAAFAAVIYEIENGIAGDIDEILKENNLAKENIIQKEINRADLEMQGVYEEICHHTYLEECYIMECIREGRPEDARERINAPVGNTGTLSLKEKNHYKNLAIAAVALSTREAMKGGVSPASAYQLSDVYINRIDQCTDIDELEGYSGKIVCEFAKLVAETKKEKGMSVYTEQCRDYIEKHFHNKIYLEDIADAIGISQGHLSRIFRKDMGISVQDYIQKFRIERAANLLKYSEAGLAEISDYLCFHSQSHFGCVFKQYMNMTPRQYRDMYKQKEFRSG